MAYFPDAMHMVSGDPYYGCFAFLLKTDNVP